MLKLMTDNENLCWAVGLGVRNFAGRSFLQKMLIILLISAAVFGAATETSAAGQTTRPTAIAGRKATVDQQVDKHSISRTPKPTLQYEVETISSMGNTYKPVKGAKPNNLNRRKPGSSALEFMEVEITLSSKFNIEYISALPKAPGSDLEVLDNPKRVRVQLSASELKALADDGAEITVLRKFILVEGSRGGEAAGNDDKMAILKDLSESSSYCDGSNSTHVSIPDGFNPTWVYSSIPISCAPPGATVEYIDVHYEIIHPCRSDLDVDLNDENLDCQLDLWTEEGGCVPNINRTVTGVTVCNGELVNQYWRLWAIDWWTYDTGYIDYWWIKVYYETCEPPDNDGCVDAIPVTEEIPYYGSTVCATGTYESSCSAYDTADVWHSFTPTSTGLFTISLRDSAFDTTLTVFDECSGTELACNDDISYPDILQSELTMSLTAATTYIIRVAGYDGATGSYTLLVEGCSPPLVNDDCVNAIAVVEGTAYYGSTVCATGTYESTCSFGDTADVWYSYTPSSTGTATISLRGSAFDTTLTVFDECGGTELACNDDILYPDNPQSEIIMKVVGAQTYLIRIAGYAGAVDNYTLKVTRTPCVSPDDPYTPNPVNDAAAVGADVVLSWSNDAKALHAAGNKDAALPSKDTIMPKVIYGTDDRLEECEVGDADILLLGDSTAAMVDANHLINNGNGTFSLPTETLAEWYRRVNPIETGNPLCLDEPYRNQPNPATCSGFLVAPDIVVTAGHCSDIGDGCGDMAFVFGFVVNGPDCNVPVLTIDASEIYYCTEVIASSLLGSDWALIRLDREVVGHNPLRVRVADAVSNDEPLLVVGHPAGLPRKYAGGANVKSNNALSPKFEANLDTYGGNSGSAVFNANTLKVEGILVQGNPDWKAGISCDASNVCPDSGCPTWEEITRTTEFSLLFPWAIYDVYFGTTNPPTELICSDLDEPMCPCSLGGTLTPDTNYYWQVVAKNSCNDSNGPVWSFTTAPAPTITGWEIAATHGAGIGEIRCPVEDGYVEPRVNGVTKLRVCFDTEMDISVTDPNAISIEGVNNGTQPHPCSIAWQTSDCMIITLCSALPDQNTYTITIGAEVKSAAGYALAGDRSICITALKGDANSSLEVNAQDLLAIRPHAGEPVDCSNARYDINCSGAKNAQDMLAARANAGHTAPQCPN